MRSARAHFPKPRKIIRGAETAISVTLLEERVVVRVGRRTAAQDPELARAVVLERVPRTGWDQGRVPRSHALPVAVDLERAGSFQHEVDLLARAVVVALGRLARLERRLREALALRVVELADRRAVLRRERLRPVHRLHVHVTIIPARRPAGRD